MDHQQLESKINIGSNVRIGANTVVLESISDNANVINYKERVIVRDINK